MDIVLKIVLAIILVPIIAWFIFWIGLLAMGFLTISLEKINGITDKSYIWEKRLNNRLKNSFLYKIFPRKIDEHAKHINENLPAALKRLKLDSLAEK